MKNAKHLAAAAVASDGSIFVGGGSDHHGKSSNSVARYHPDTNEWTDVANTKCCQGEFALVEWKGSVHAIGGRCVEAVERYDSAKNEWTSVRNKLIQFSNYDVMAFKPLSNSRSALFTIFAPCS